MMLATLQESPAIYESSL